jgi:hypothetical protein
MMRPRPDYTNPEQFPRYGGDHLDPEPYGTDRRDRYEEGTEMPPQRTHNPQRYAIIMFVIILGIYALAVLFMVASK